MKTICITSFLACSIYICNIFAMDLNTLLLKAASEEENNSYIIELINKKANVNALNEKKQTVLMCAASKGFENNLQTLLSYNADPNTTYFYKYINVPYCTNLSVYTDVPYMTYADSNEWREDVFSYQCNNVLITVGEYGHKSCMEILLPYMKQPFMNENKKTWPYQLCGKSIGEIALMSAIKNNHKHCTEMLLEYAKKIDCDRFYRSGLQEYFKSLPQSMYKNELRKQLALVLLCNKRLKEKSIPKPIFLGMIIKWSITPDLPLLRELFEAKNLKINMFGQSTILDLNKRKDMQKLLQKYKNLLGNKHEKGLWNGLVSKFKSFF